MPEASDEYAAGRDAALAERYEQLRSAALGGGSDGWRLGLGVLAGKGVAGWIRAWTTCPSPAPAVSGHASSGPARLDVADAELVRVLTAMALAHA